MYDTKEGTAFFRGFNIISLCIVIGSSQRGDIDGSSQRGDID